MEYCWLARSWWNIAVSSVFMTKLAENMAIPPIAPESCDVRDWAHLDALVADLIAEYALANGVVDMYSFREVCKPGACSDYLRPQGVLDRRFQPRGWILLPNTFNDGVRSNRWRLMNTFTGKRIIMTVPDHHHVIGNTSEGLLLLGRTDTDDNMELLNPITGHMISNLPPASTLGLAKDFRLCDIDLRGAGVADDSTVVLHFKSFSLALAKPGDERWTQLYSSSKRILSTLQFAGRVYCATETDVSVVQTVENQRPQLVVAAAYQLDQSPHGNSRRLHFSDRSRMFLVDNNGELIACHHDCCDPCIHGSCYLYRVDLDAGYTVPLLERLNNGHALFISTTRSVLASSGVFPVIRPDTVYLCAGTNIAFDRLGTCAERKFKKSDAANYLTCYVSS